MRNHDTIKLSRRIVENSLPYLKAIEHSQDVLLLVQEIENVSRYDLIAEQQEKAFKLKNFDVYDVLKEERQKEKIRLEEFREKAFSK